MSERQLTMMRFFVKNLSIVPCLQVSRISCCCHCESQYEKEMFLVKRDIKLLFFRITKVYQLSCVSTSPCVNFVFSCLCRRRDCLSDTNRMIWLKNTLQRNETRYNNIFS